MDQVYEEIFYSQNERIINLSRKLRDLETSKSELLSKVKASKIYTGSGPGQSWGSSQLMLANLIQC
jgi:hypothetical protein